MPTAKKAPNPTGKGLQPGYHRPEQLAKRREPLLPPELSNSQGALPILKERARGDFAKRINLLADIADGKTVQRVRQKGPHGETVTEYTPSAKDRMTALRMLGSYGLVPTTETDTVKGGGGLDPATMTRALLGALSDPVVRRTLLADPQLGDTVRLLTAEAVPASVMPGEDELNAVTAREIVIEAPE